MAEDQPSDFAILSMAIDSQSLFHRTAQRLNSRRQEEAIDDVFQGLLSDANGELASLLRDVQAESQGALLGEFQSQSINDLLMRAVRCAAKQYMLQAELGSLVLTDELTGLYNRRGFIALAERQLKLARRSSREMMLFFMDVNGLKQINDSCGHSEGDRALKCTAQALERTFRDSDVIARLGGDEFAVLAIEASAHSEITIEARLCEYLSSGTADQCHCPISLSLGVARFDPRRSTPLEEVMIEADRAMYEKKRRRSRPFVENTGH